MTRARAAGSGALRRRRRLVGALLVALAACSDGRGELDGPAAVPAEEALGAVLYVAIGGTETTGSALGFPGQLRDSWPHLLQREALPRRSVFVNLAEDGATAATALAEQVPQALELRPTIVTVWLDGDADVLEELVTALRRGGETRVLVVDDEQASARSLESLAETTGAELVQLDAGLAFSAADQPRIVEQVAAVVGEIS